MIRHSASMFRRQGLVQVRWGIFVPLPSYTLSWVLREYFMINFCFSFQLKRIASRCEGEVPRRSGKCKSACCKWCARHWNPYLIQDRMQ